MRPAKGTGLWLTSKGETFRVTFCLDTKLVRLYKTPIIMHASTPLRVTKGYKRLEAVTYKLASDTESSSKAFGLNAQ